MRLNHECVRSALLFIEEEHKLGMFLQLPEFLDAKSLSEFSKDDIEYTLLQLTDAGFIVGKARYGGNTLVSFSCAGLTWNGSQFIDTIRDDKVWRKTKDAVSKLSSVSLTVLSSLATAILSKLLGL